MPCQWASTLRSCWHRDAHRGARSRSRDGFPVSSRTVAAGPTCGARVPADRRGNPVASVTACAAPERGVLSLRLSGRAGCCCRCWPGGRELEFTVGQQLAASHYPHPLISGNALSRAEPVHTLPPAAAQTAAGPGFAAGLGSASLCRQARGSAGRTCQPVRRRHRTRQRSGGNRPAHRHPRCCLGWGTRPAGRRDKLITARRCQPPARRPLPG